MVSTNKTVLDLSTIYTMAGIGASGSTGLVGDFGSYISDHINPIESRTTRMTMSMTIVSTMARMIFIFRALD